MNGYNGFNAQVGTADFLTSLSTLLLENGLRADQVALGLHQHLKLHQVDMCQQT